MYNHHLLLLLQSQQFRLCSPFETKSFNSSYHKAASFTSKKERGKDLAFSSADCLGYFVGIEAVFLLHLLDQVDVYLLGFGGADAFLDDLFPCLVFVLCLRTKIEGLARFFVLGGGREGFLKRPLL
jgi:hypothetical protein